MSKRLLLLFALCVFATSAFGAACVNRFVSREQRPHQVVTLLTGKLTFQEAQELSKAISEKKAPPLEWLDEAGKTISRQYGELQVVRPMPVGCDGRSSGVVVIVTFPSFRAPSKVMHVRLRPDEVVPFVAQD